MTLPFVQSTSSFAPPPPCTSSPFAPSPSPASASLPSALAIHARNRSRVAMMPLPFVNPSNCARSRRISAHTQRTYACVSGRRSLPFGTLLALGPLLSSVFVTSRQSRYIRYGSSNLTLKKKDEPAGYGADLPPLAVGVVPTCVRTTKPSTASPFHCPAWATCSVKALTSGIVCRTVDAVGMKPHSCAKASTTGWGCVWNDFVHALRPCRCRPVLSAL